MGWDFFDVRFDLGPVLQGQTRIAKPNSTYDSLIIGPRGLQYETNFRKSWAGNLLIRSDLTLGPPSRLNEDTQT